VRYSRVDHFRHAPLALRYSLSDPVDRLRLDAKRCDVPRTIRRMPDNKLHSRLRTRLFIGRWRVSADRYSIAVNKSTSMRFGKLKWQLADQKAHKSCITAYSEVVFESRFVRSFRYLAESRTCNFPQAINSARMKSLRPLAWAAWVTSTRPTIRASNRGGDPPAGGRGLHLNASSARRGVTNSQLLRPSMGRALWCPGGVVHLANFYYFRHFSAPPVGMPYSALGGLPPF